MTRMRVLLLGAVVVIGAGLWGRGQAAPRDEMLELYGLFVDAVERVEANYVKPVSRKELLENALKGMLMQLDPHSSYFSEAEWAQFRKQIEGTFTGIGVSIELDQRSGSLKVLAPLPGSPAYAAGIQPGDRILEVDGKSTEGMTRDDAVEALQGRPGTQVTLKVKHLMEPEPVAVTITRAIIELPSVIGDSRKADETWDYMIDKDRKIGYARITNFVEDTPEELKKALEDLKGQGMKGLVLDLRDDPGGLLSAAVEVSDLFLSEGKIVTTKGRNQRDKVYEAEEAGTYAGFPIAVLINQHSASASEIVSAALQDHGRAIVVGQRSFGKGSVQNILPLDDGNSILKLTVATYWRPSGKNIHRFTELTEKDEWGVSPDDGLEVKLSPAEYEKWVESRRDRDLLTRLGRQPQEDQPRKAKKNEEEKNEEEKKPPTVHEGIEDRQLDKALDEVAKRITEAEKGGKEEEKKPEQNKAASAAA